MNNRYWIGIGSRESRRMSWRQLERQLRRGAENMASMKDQLEAQMNQILQSLQSIGNCSHSPNNSDSTHNGFGSGNYNGSNCTRFTKMEFPKFNGENVEGWLYKVEHFL
ncbi:hypothetical protein R6Q59_028068 [Mikania micrantha]